MFTVTCTQALDAQALGPQLVPASLQPYAVTVAQLSVFRSCVLRLGAHQVRADVFDAVSRLFKKC